MSIFLANTTGSSPCLGRVPISYSAQESSTRDLAIAYQSVIIAITFILCCIFFVFTILLYQRAKNIASSKTFVTRVGGAIGLSFLIRCILYLIILSVNFVSAVYLFITLMITEVIPMGFLFLVFYSRQLKLASTLVSNASSTSGPRSSSSQSSSKE
jgi:hypothetical protein